MQIIMYTTHCPNCKVLAMKMKEKNIDYVEKTGIDEMIQLGIRSVPYLKVDDKLLNFVEALKWVREQ